MANIRTWKHDDRDVEDYMAKNYDYVYNRTIFGKAMYKDFAKEIDIRLRAYLTYQQHVAPKTRQKRVKVLELGCGTAIISNILSTHKNNGIAKAFEIFSIDYSLNMIKIAKTRCDFVVQSDMESLPFRESVFDIVYVHSALHHFPFFSAIMKGVKTILKPSGIFIIQEPCNSNIKKDLFLRSVSFLLRKIGTRVNVDLSRLERIPSDHHGPLSVSKLISHLEECGFAIERKKYKYYVSRILSGYDSNLANFIGRVLDDFYIKKFNQGYLVIIISKNEV